MKLNIGPVTVLVIIAAVFFTDLTFRAVIGPPGRPSTYGLVAPSHSSGPAAVCSNWVNGPKEGCTN